MQNPQKLEAMSMHAPQDFAPSARSQAVTPTPPSHRAISYQPAQSPSAASRANPPPEPVTFERVGRFLVGLPLVLVVFALIFWSWYVHILRMDVSLYRNNKQALAIIDGFVFHVLLLLLSISYLRCSFSNPGYVPRAVSQPASVSVSIPMVERREGDKTFCTKCESEKPDRAHHCRLCGRCVHRMDHHCPWVNNCVGRDNYKFFALFLLYTCLAALYNTITVGVWAVKSDAKDITSGAMQWAAVWINLFATGVFGVVLFFFCGFHAQLLAKNQTTIESLDRSSQYDLGSAGANVRQILGDSPWGWLLPVRARAAGSTGSQTDRGDVESGAVGAARS